MQINSITWLPVAGHEGYYEVSSEGQVRSLSREITSIREDGSKRVWTIKQRIIKAATTKQGYKLVILCNDSVRTTHYVHRLVAQAFIPNLSGKPTVNHINGVKDDNNTNNLEWATSVENIRHAITNGLRTDSFMSPNLVRKIRAEYVKGKHGFGTPSLARKYNLSHSSVWALVTGKYWKDV